MKKQVRKQADKRTGSRVKKRTGRQGGVFFVIAAIIMSVVVWGNPIARVQSFFLPNIPAIVPASQSLAAIDLTVDGSVLMSHVNAIAQQRRTATEKAVAREYILSQLASYGLSGVEQPYSHPKTGDAATGGVNIVATLPGRDPAASTLVLGGHYDSLENSPGADDNGSAIASMLETARLMSSLMSTEDNVSTEDQEVSVEAPSSLQVSSLQSSSLSAATLPFPNTLKLVFFDQEERQPDGSGLLGSTAFTADADNIRNLKGAIILEMIGYACRQEGCQRYPQGLPTQNLPTAGDFLAVLGLSDHTELIGAFVGSAQKTWPLIVSLPIPQSTLRLLPD
ncbi:MAG: M28 family peptidase, partial [Cyanobacteria bacterium J06650_10]